MARYRSDAFPCCRPWRDCAPMRSRRGLGRGKTPARGNISPACIQIQLILARYARHASEKPRRAPLGNAPREHLAAKGRFRRPKPPDHARRTNLAALRWPCPCAGAPARAAASRDRLSTAWPLRRGACPQRLADTRHLPTPATRCARCSQRQAADGLRRRSSGAWPAVRPSPEGPPTASSRRVGRQRSAAQNRRRRPQAGPGLRQRCQKRPSKGRVPLGGTIGTPQKNSHQSCFLRLPLAEFAPVAVSPTVPQLRQEFSQHKRHAGFLGLPFDQFAPVVLTVVPVGFTAPMPRRAFLGCISPVRTRAVRDLLVLLRLLKLPVLRLATRIEMMTQSIA